MSLTKVWNHQNQGQWGKSKQECVVYFGEGKEINQMVWLRNSWVRIKAALPGPILGRGWQQPSFSVHTSSPTCLPIQGDLEGFSKCQQGEAPEGMEDWPNLSNTLLSRRWTSFFPCYYFLPPTFYPFSCPYSTISSFLQVYLIFHLSPHFSPPLSR